MNPIPRIDYFVDKDEPPPRYVKKVKPMEYTPPKRINAPEPKQEVKDNGGFCDPAALIPRKNDVWMNRFNDWDGRSGGE